MGIDWIIEKCLNIKTKELLKTINLLGQEVKYRNSENGEILFKIYDDGSVVNKIMKLSSEWPDLLSKLLHHSKSGSNENQQGEPYRSYFFKK